MAPCRAKRILTANRFTSGQKAAANRPLCELAKRLHILRQYLERVKAYIGIPGKRMRFLPLPDAD